MDVEFYILNNYKKYIRVDYSDYTVMILAELVMKYTNENILIWDKQEKSCYEKTKALSF
jgi:hypothetical protein